LLDTSEVVANVITADTPHTDVITADTPHTDVTTADTPHTDEIKFKKWTERSERQITTDNP
jgi:hypothetical protein